MEENKMESITKTTTQQAEENTSNDEIIVQTALFIIFAEYLGYISPFNKIATDWCDGQEPDAYNRRLLEIEAKCILRQMKKDYGIDKIRFWYNTYYPVVIEDLEKKLNDGKK